MTPTIRHDGSRTEVELPAEGEMQSRRLTLEREPGDVSDILWFDVSLWDEPARTPLSEDELQAVLDALATNAHGYHLTIAQHREGFAVLLRGAPGERLVGTYQTGYDTGYVTLLEVGRTACVDVTQRLPFGLVKATLLRETARWLHPVKGPVSDAEWPRIEAALFAADRSAFYKGEKWLFERAAPEESHAPTG